MKTHNMQITNADACFVYDLLNEITFTSRRCRENPQFVTVRAITKWNIGRLLEIQRAFDKIVNEED